MFSENCFKAYDIRGKVPDALDEALAYRIGAAYAKNLAPRKVVVGRDSRLTSPSIASAVVEGLLAQGVDIIDLGVVGTEVVYYAAFSWISKAVDGGIMVTASHNPKEYNGMKLVGRGAVPIHRDNGLQQIESDCLKIVAHTAAARGIYSLVDPIGEYAEYLMSLIDREALQSMHIVTDAGNGAAGKALDALKSHLPFTYTHLRHEPDGNFPQGVPNPLLPECRSIISDELKGAGADFGVAFDGDFDRCFLFDHLGEFVDGYYIVGLLAEYFLSRTPGEKIVYEPRSIWNTLEVIENWGGKSVLSKTGHAFIKQKMRHSDAIYGGEMSGHHYFRQFGYCDSGMLPWLLISSILSRSGKALSELVADKQRRFPISGELNFKVQKSFKEIAGALSDSYEKESIRICDVDGRSFEFENWRFNIRMSNTEPLLRLNIESRHNKSLLSEKQKELSEFIYSLQGP